jgi:predicted transport protein
MGKNLRRDDIDWSQSRIIFVSPNFTDYQKQSVNFKDVPFELWEIKKYDDQHILLNQHKTDSEVSITTTSSDTTSIVSNVSRQVMVYTETYHLHEVKNRKESVIELYNRFRERVVSLGEVEIVPRKHYISYQRGRPFTDVEFQKDNLLVFINMKKGTLNDPNKLTIDVSGKGHQGNGDYSFLFKEDSDLDYLMFLINQSYKDKGQ